MDIVIREHGQRVSEKSTYRKRAIIFENAQELVAFAKDANSSVDGADRGISGDRDLTQDANGGCVWTFGTTAVEHQMDTHDAIHTAIEEGRTLPNLAEEVDRYRKIIVEDMMESVKTEEHNVKRRRVWAEDGAALDIDRVMCGDPDYWVKTQRNGVQRVVRICINVSASGGNSESTFVRTLALSYVTAEMLERMGHGVEIHMVCSAHKMGHNSRYQTVKNLDEEAVVVPVKKSQEPLDINRIGFGAMPGYLRAVIPSIVCGVEKTNVCFNGTCSVTSKEMQELLGSDVLIETMWGSGRQKREVRKFLEDLS